MTNFKSSPAYKAYIQSHKAELATLSLLCAKVRTGGAAGALTFHRKPPTVNPDDPEAMRRVVETASRFRSPSGGKR